MKGEYEVLCMPQAIHILNRLHNMNSDCGLVLSRLWHSALNQPPQNYTSHLPSYVKDQCPIQWYIV